MFRLEKLPSPEPPQARPALSGSILVAAFLSIFLISFSSSRCFAADQADMLLSLLTQVESSYAKVNDYTATFQKQETMDNLQQPSERIAIKFKKPFMVYLKWMDIPIKEALYVDGQNNNKATARISSIFGPITVTFKPTNIAVMRINRHPISDIGFGFIIDVMRRNIPVAIQNSELNIIGISEESLANRPSIRIEAKFSPKGKRLYYTSRLVLYIDKELLLPVAIACYDEKDVVQEIYSYVDIKLNTGLTDTEFSLSNKAYRF